MLMDIGLLASRVSVLPENNKRHVSGSAAILAPAGVD